MKKDRSERETKKKLEKKLLIDFRNEKKIEFRNCFSTAWSRRRRLLPQHSLLFFFFTFFFLDIRTTQIK